MFNVKIRKNRDNNRMTIENLSLVFNSRVLMHRTSPDSTEISFILNPTLKGLIAHHSPNIFDHLNKNKSTFSDRNLTDIVRPNFENSLIPLKFNQT